VIGESINLVIRASDDLDPVLADPGQLEQVVLNLAVNARDAMPRGGTLTIDMRNVDLDEAFAAAHPGVSTGPHVALSLTDTGSGMTPEVSSRIFEPFFTTKRQGKGTGLGLATVYGIVTRSGGAITVESQPGWGSSFRIFLPRATSASVTWEPPVQTDYSNGSETILLTEDEDSARELTMRMLEAAGYTVLTANSGSTALSILERYGKPLHLLLTDVVMPGMSGPELASSAKLMHPNLPILFVSGYTDDAVFSDGVSRGASHFLSKPYTLTELASKVRQVLDTATGGV
jgi:CheY-like chemotaxis protein